MNCKEVKYKIISKESTEDSDFLNHINKCKECYLFNKNYSNAINRFHENKRTENDSFFYSRLMAKIERRQENKSQVFSGKFKLAFISILLVFAISSGITLGYTAINTFKSYSDFNKQIVADDLTNNIDNSLFTIE